MRFLPILPVGLTVLFSSWGQTASAAVSYPYAPPPSPAILVPPPPQAMSFSVYYDFDSANLSRIADSHCWNCTNGKGGDFGCRQHLSRAAGTDGSRSPRAAKPPRGHRPGEVDASQSMPILPSDSV